MICWCKEVLGSPSACAILRQATPSIWCLLLHFCCIFLYMSSSACSSVSIPSSSLHHLSSFCHPPGRLYSALLSPTASSPHHSLCSHYFLNLDSLPIFFVLWLPSPALSLPLCYSSSFTFQFHQFSSCPVALSPADLFWTSFSFVLLLTDPSSKQGHPVTDWDWKAPESYT